MNKTILSVTLLFISLLVNTGCGPNQPNPFQTKTITIALDVQPSVFDKNGNRLTPDPNSRRFTKLQYKISNVAVNGQKFVDNITINDFEKGTLLAESNHKSLELLYPIFQVNSQNQKDLTTHIIENGTATITFTLESIKGTLLNTDLDGNWTTQHIDLPINQRYSCEEEVLFSGENKFSALLITESNIAYKMTNSMELSLNLYTDKNNPPKEFYITKETLPLELKQDNAKYQEFLLRYMGIDSYFIQNPSYCTLIEN